MGTTIHPRDRRGAAFPGSNVVTKAPASATAAVPPTIQRPAPACSLSPTAPGIGAKPRPNVTPPASTAICRVLGWPAVRAASARPAATTQAASRATSSPLAYSQKLKDWPPKLRNGRNIAGIEASAPPRIRLGPSGRRVNGSAAALRPHWRAAPGPIRTPSRRGGRPSGRTRARPRVDRVRRGRRPSRGCTRPSAASQRAAGGESGRVREALRRRVRVGEERRLAVARVAGPPADRDLLGIHRVARDEVVRRRVGRHARRTGSPRGRTSPTRR